MSDLHTPQPTDALLEPVVLLSEAIADRHPVMALTGPRGSGKSEVVAAVIRNLEGQPVSFLRIGNPLSTPLSLGRVLIQICGEDDATAGAEADEAARVMQALRQRTGSFSRAVIVVEQAETLLPPALRLLHLLTRISDPRLPLVQVLFVGGEAFWNLLQDPSFNVLRAQLATAIALPARQIDPPEVARPEPAYDAEDASPGVLVATPSERLAAGGAPARRRRGGLGIGVAVVAAAVAAFALFHTRAPEPTPAPREKLAEAEPATPASPAIVVPPLVPVPATRPLDRQAEPISPRPGTQVEPAPRPLAPPAADPGPAAGEPQHSLPTVSQATRRQLRQQFDAFVRQSRGDIAALPPAQRDELFEQYLARYLAQQASGTDAPTQPFAQAPAAPPASILPEPVRRPAPVIAARRVVIHYKSTSDAARLAAARMSSTLEDTHTELRPVDAVPRTPSIRYFSPEDRDTARQLAAMLGSQDRQQDGDWDVQDFSAYRPRPTQGTIEIWLPPS